MCQCIGEARLPGLTLEPEECFAHFCGDQRILHASYSECIDLLIVHADVGMVLHASDRERRRLSALTFRPVLTEGRKPLVVRTIEVAEGSFSKVDRNASKLTCCAGRPSEQCGRGNHFHCGALDL
jgi:hypothetical protein